MCSESNSKISNSVSHYLKHLQQGSPKLPTSHSDGNRSKGWDQGGVTRGEWGIPEDKRAGCKAWACKSEPRTERALFKLHQELWALGKPFLRAAALASSTKAQRSSWGGLNNQLSNNLFSLQSFATWWAELFLSLLVHANSQSWNWPFRYMISRKIALASPIKISDLHASTNCLLSDSSITSWKLRLRANISPSLIAWASVVKGEEANTLELEPARRVANLSRITAPTEARG